MLWPDLLLPVVPKLAIPVRLWAVAVQDGFSKEPDDTGGNVVAVMQDIWRTEGLRGFWRGVVAGSIYYSAWACLFFGTYEIVAAVVV